MTNGPKSGIIFIVNDIRNCTLSVPAKAEIMAFTGLQAQFLMLFIIYFNFEERDR